MKSKEILLINSETCEIVKIFKSILQARFYLKKSLIIVKNAFHDDSSKAIPINGYFLKYLNDVVSIRRNDDGKEILTPLIELSGDITDKKSLIGLKLVDDEYVIKHKNKLSFIIPGQPKGKGRPRFRRFGKFVSTYTDKKTLEYENKIKDIYIKLDSRPKDPIEVPIEANIKFKLQIPNSLSKKKQLLLEGKPCFKKPDLDNLIKSLLDGLNGVSFIDDSQVFSIVARKVNSMKPETIVKFKW
ncbi:MAG: RusA family crossover junction endodeoxyribonuclease [archaeon]